jgi:hypothetical protein
MKQFSLAHEVFIEASKFILLSSFIIWLVVNITGFSMVYHNDNSPVIHHMIYR